MSDHSDVESVSLWSLHRQPADMIADHEYSLWLDDEPVIMANAMPGHADKLQLLVDALNAAPRNTPAGSNARNPLARQWLNKADEIDRQIAEYDPSERHLGEVHALEVEAETLRKCANELYGPPAPVEEEIKF